MIRRIALCVASVLAMTSSSFASERGPVTNLPMPRFVSMKAEEGNVRRGPSLSHRIDWIFKHQNMPLQVTDEYGHWRRVQDAEGQGGWMHFRLLSGARTAVIVQDKTRIRRRPNEGSEAFALAETGVIARLEECSPDWCRIKVGRTRGWVKKAEIWGVKPDEIRE